MRKEINPALRRAVRLALLAGGATGVASLLPSIASAQTATNTADDQTSQLKEVVVTGSRIASPSLDAISPVTAVSSEEFKETGTTRVEDLLNSLPQVVADQSSGLSMTANGTATVNLRGLGVQRTLVLVNGRRLQGGDPGAIQGGSGGEAYASAGDINQIPTALIERVDVLTGGASSTYGADAVAGVVNFVMNDHFEGVRVDANLGIYNHHNHQPADDALLTAAGNPAVTGSNWDGSNKDFTIIVGHNFDDGAGNFEGYLGYRRTSAITANHRDHSACTLTDSSSGAVPFSCGGSSTTAPAVFQNPAIGKFQVDDTGALVKQYNHFNYGASHYLQRNDERYTAGFFAHLKFNEHAEAYSEFMFMDDQTTGAYAPAGSFLGSGKASDADTGLPDGALSYNCGTGGFGNAGMNPYITAGEFPKLCPETGGGAPLAYTNKTNTTGAFPYQMSAAGIGQIIIGRRNIEGGPRQDEYTHDSYRGVFGVRGEITSGWTYDAYALFATTRSSDYHNNDTSTERIQNSLLAVAGPNGTPVCQGGQSGCVPWSIFNPAVAVSPATLAYISVPGVFLASEQENIGEAYVSGDLTQYGIKTPWANDGLKVVLGADYRRDTLSSEPDAEWESGDLSGVGSPSPPVEAAQHVWEVYTEARLPLVHDVPFAKSLDFETGYRYSTYSEGFNTNTFKFGLEWAPVSDVRLRASYNRSVRAPNLQELYQPQHVALDGSDDLCGTGSALTAAQCALTGAPAAGAARAPSSQYNGLIGGTPTLKPEVGKTYDIGLVFTPTFLPKLSATLDYTDIKISGLVNSYGSSLIQSNCTATGLAFWCGLIHRDGSGTLWASPSGYVVDPLINEGQEEYRGVDIGLAYSVNLGAFGALRTRFDGTWLKDLIFSPGGPGSESYNCAGRFGLSCDPITPTWRHRATVDYDTPVTGLSAGIVWRFIGKAVNTIVDPKEPDFLPGWEDGGSLPDDHIPNYNYFDLHASYVWNKLTMRVGCNNIADKDPPPVSGKTGGNDLYYDNNTYASVYDLAGRFIFMNVTMDF
ncbi:MAG TPA: TonB-dependent receptor [Steroidobacteraceae bacterium]|nr:TonB-dependent receptor [Steroidobacteraceae bacterium]